MSSKLKINPANIDVLNNSNITSNVSEEPKPEIFWPACWQKPIKWLSRDIKEVVNIVECNAPPRKLNGNDVEVDVVLDYSKKTFKERGITTTLRDIEDEIKKLEEFKKEKGDDVSSSLKERIKKLKELSEKNKSKNPKDPIDIPEEDELGYYERDTNDKGEWYRKVVILMQNCISSPIQSENEKNTPKDACTFLFTYIHELFHSYFDSDLQQFNNNVEFIEEPIVEYAMLKFIENQLKDDPYCKEINLLNYASEAVRAAQATFTSSHYGFGYFLWKYEKNNGKDYDWIDLFLKAKYNIKDSKDRREYEAIFKRGSYPFEDEECYMELLRTILLLAPMSNVAQTSTPTVGQVSGNNSNDKTMMKTIQLYRHKTDLPYDCIFYVSGKDNGSSKSQLLPKQGTVRVISTIPEYKFRFCMIRSDVLLSDSEMKRLDEESRWIINNMRGIFPIMDHGYFVVHLLPEWDSITQSMDTAYDTLLVGIPEDSDPSNPLTFAEIAAEVNFDRITGGTDTEDFSEDDIFCVQTIKERSDKYKRQVSIKKKQLAEKYLDIISDYLNNSNHDFERLMELMQSGADACRNVDRLNDFCQIKALYSNETDDYELLVCPPKDEAIVCDFGGRVQAKALYIFFLRHLEGITFKDLQTPNYLDELTRIYAKLCYGNSRGSHSIMESFVSGNSRSQAIKAIREFFKQLFVEPIASDYSIESRDNQRNGGRYGVKLKSKLVDLGDFEKI